MHTDRARAEALLGALRVALDGVAGGGLEVVIFPPAPWLPLAADAFAGSALQVGVQNVFFEREGAFTGEVSAALVRGTATWALVGHSERRHRFGESDGDTTAKLRAVLDEGLRPVLAVGELREEREAGRTRAVLERQLLAAFDGLAALPPGFVVAYEPVWAIGTGLAATPEMAEEACAIVRGVVRARFDATTAEACRVQYGGSVNAGNIAGFAGRPGVDGALVGGASLDAEAFAGICRAVAAERAA
ncbi:MAG: triose-phosphate isomerase [Chloroflexi bacterium]|nr:triose-phosphate isomerase [Chloroflexota bacterium]